MKKIIVIDGGPRKNFNTASMLQKFAEGASSVRGDIEVKTVRLYGLDYKGCMSCMACSSDGNDERHSGAELCREPTMPVSVWRKVF